MNSKKAKIYLLCGMVGCVLMGLGDWLMLYGDSTTAHCVYAPEVLLQVHQCMKGNTLPYRYQPRFPLKQHKVSIVQTHKDCFLPANQGILKKCWGQKVYSL